MSGLASEAGEAADRLARLERERDEAREAVAEVGEERVAAVANAHREATSLLDRYADSATGTGDFEAYVEFQERFLGLVEELDDDLPEREAFEAAAETLDRRRLRERDFAQAREEIAPAGAYADMLDRREDAAERYRTARHEAESTLAAVEERIESLERLCELGEADLDAPVERLRDPVEAYNDAVREAFDDYRRSASARELFDLVDATVAYPLVEFRRPPRDLREYVESHAAGDEPVPTLLEYADYSASKLDHYVDDPGALRAKVATHRTYLERLDADPLTVAWPPAPAGVLRRRARELVAVVGRFAPEEVVARARTVRDLPRETAYERLREAAVARAELDEAERERLASGAASAELSRLREAREELAAALGREDA
ncbi:MAG: hypothetical protein ABEJ61_05370 [Haloferacaceae archaeon]